MKKEIYIQPTIEETKLQIESLLASHSNNEAESKGNMMFDDEDEEMPENDKSNAWK
jgi:hypothetical protein